MLSRVHRIAPRRARVTHAVISNLIIFVFNLTRCAAPHALFQIVMKTHRCCKLYRSMPSPESMRDMKDGKRCMFQFYYEFVCSHAKRGCPCSKGRIGIFTEGVGNCTCFVWRHVECHDQHTLMQVSRHGEAWSFTHQYELIVIEFAQLMSSDGINGIIVCEHDLQWNPPRLGTRSMTWLCSTFKSLWSTRDHHATTFTAPTNVFIFYPSKTEQKKWTSWTAKLCYIFLYLRHVCDPRGTT